MESPLFSRKIIYSLYALAFLLGVFSFCYPYFFSTQTLSVLSKTDAYRMASTGATTSEAVMPAVPVKREKPAKRPVYGIYLTAYSGGSTKKMDNILAAVKNSKINAVVVDIKDYTGYLDYDSQIPLVKNLGLKQVKIKDLPALTKKLHDNNLYAIARVAVFQDPALSSRKPEWAVLNKNTGGIWRDRKGLSWLDPANPEVWDYHVDIAKEAIALGFDEVNFDYIRFPSDGAISAMQFPKWATGTKAMVIKDFFAHLHEKLKDEPAYISADLFGLTTTVIGDMNIGQVLVNAAPYFDYICPMVYPSHYPAGYMQYANPAAHPYEVIYKAIKTGNGRIASTTDAIAEIRPWIQDFNMGATYDANMILKEIKASDDAGGIGWLAWDPKNIYTWGAYRKN